MFNDSISAADETQPPFRDRADAAEALARGLTIYSVASHVVVLGLARGGVPIARCVADVIGASFGVLTSRHSIAADEQSRRQLAVGADRAILDERDAWYIGIARPLVDPGSDFPWVELERGAQTHRITQPMPDLRGHVVVIVDDGLATGATMRAAVRAVRRSSPAAVVGAVPVASCFGAANVTRELDDFYAVLTPEKFESIASFYGDYPTVTDDDVLRLLGSPGSVVISGLRQFARSRRNSGPRVLRPGPMPG